MILADTSGVVATLVRQDPAHERAVRYTRSLREPLYLPTACVGEIGCFLEQRASADVEARFLRSLTTGPFLAIEAQAPDYLRAADLVLQYADFPLGAVDALIVAIAERLNVTTILTLDRRHFSAVRPLHRRSFTLVP